MADVEPDARHAARADGRQPVGQRGARRLPDLRLLPVDGAGEGVVDGVVQRLQRFAGGRRGGCRGRRGHGLVATGHANARAQPADRDAAAHVQQRRARARVRRGLAHVLRDRHRTAADRLPRQLHAQRRQQPRGFERGADDDGVEGLGACRLAGRREAHGRPRARRDGRDLVLEQEAHAQVLCVGAQQLRPFAGVADAGVRQVHGARRVVGHRAAGFELALARRVGPVGRLAAFLQPGDGGLGLGGAGVVAQRQQQAVAALEVQAQRARQLVDALDARREQPVQRERAFGAPRGLGAVALAEQRGRGERGADAAQPARLVGAARHRLQPARRGQPRRGQAGGGDAGGREAGLLGDAGAALDHRHLVAVGCERLRGRDTGHAGADHRDPHRASGREKWKARAELMQDRVRPAILFGFFWVAIRRRKSRNTKVSMKVLGSSARTGLKSPKSANPAIKVLWSR